MRRTTEQIVVALAAALALATVLAPSGCSSSTTPDLTPRFTKEQLQDPVACLGCHKDHVAEWQSSMHAYAADDPVFRAMNARGQRETNGQLGTFCVKCHAPMAVETGATKDGLNLDAIEPRLKGVTCFFCHSVDEVNGDHNAPMHLADDGVFRGEYADPAANTAHRATYSGLHDGDQLDSSKLCGACHDITTDHGANIERTFQEWRGTIYNASPAGQTCSQCHMKRSPTLVPIAQVSEAKPRRRHAHYFPAVDVPLTDGFPDAAGHRARVEAALGNNVLQSALCVAPLAGSFALRVLLHNVSAGHSFPSGSAQDRRLWVEVAAYQGDTLLYSSGAAPDGTDPAALTSDPDLWLMRDCMVDAAGKPVRMFWEAFAAGGNALDAPVTTDPARPDQAFYFPNRVKYFPRDPLKSIPGTPDRVTMRVRLLPMGYEVLDDLVASGDLDPAVRARMPTFQIGETLTWTTSAPTTAAQDKLGGRMTCVTDVPALVAAQTTDAVPATLCGP